MKYPHLIPLLLILLLGCNTEQKNRCREIRASLQTVDEKMHYYPHLAVPMLDSLQQSIPNEYFHRFEGQFLFLRAHADFLKGETDSALNKVKFAYERLISEEEEEEEEEEDKIWLARCELLLGWIAETSGYKYQAIENYSSCIVLSNYENNIESGLAYTGLGRCKSYLQEDHLNHIIQGVDILKVSDQIEFQLLARLTSYQYKLDSSLTIQTVYDILKEYKKRNLTNNIENTYKILASHYTKIGKLDSAEHLLKLAIDLPVNSFYSPILKPALWQNLGNVYLKRNNFTESKKCFQEELRLAKKFKNQSNIFYAQYSLYRLEKQKENYKYAANYLLKSTHTKIQLQKQNKQRMATIAETSLKISEIKRELEREKLKRSNLISWSITILIILSILLYLSFQYYKSTQKQKLQHAKNRTKKLKLTLDSVAEKDILLNELKSMKNPSDKEKINKLKAEFDQNFAELAANIKFIFNNLTKTELRYAVMFGMELEENVIAKIHCVKPPAVRQVKGRIRKKLGFSNNQILLEQLKLLCNQENNH